MCGCGVACHLRHAWRHLSHISLALPLTQLKSPPTGARLVEIIESTPLDDLGGEGLDGAAAAAVVEEAGNEFLPLLKVRGPRVYVCGRVCVCRELRVRDEGPGLQKTSPHVLAGDALPFHVLPCPPCP